MCPLVKSTDYSGENESSVNDVQLSQSQSVHGPIRNPCNPWIAKDRSFTRKKLLRILEFSAAAIAAFAKRGQFRIKHRGLGFISR